MKHRLFIGILAALLSVPILASCGSQDGRPAPGELYSIETGDGTFSVVKVLAVDDAMVHIRLYKNRFATRPGHVDPSELSLGSIDDEDGFGVGHIPIDLALFESWAPRFLTSRAVTEEELEGYNYWKAEVEGKD